MDSNVRVLELAAQLTAFGILPVFFFVSSRGICSLSLGVLFDNDSLPFDMAFLRRIGLRQGLFLQSHKRFPLIF